MLAENNPNQKYQKITISIKPGLKKELKRLGKNNVSGYISDLLEKQLKEEKIKALNSKIRNFPKVGAKDSEELVRKMRLSRSKRVIDKHNISNN